MPKSKHTIRSLARLLGLSRTTVSAALHDSPRVVEPTRRRVQELARQVGYEQNPFAAALMSQIRHSRLKQFSGVLAAVELRETPPPAAAMRFHEDLLRGANRRATELGFSVEHVIVGAEHLLPRQLDAELRSRDIQGVIVLPSCRVPDLSPLCWSQYAGVYADYVVGPPLLHSVCCDHFRSMVAVLNRVKEVGYQRPGLLLQEAVGPRLQFRWEAALRVAQHKRLGFEKVAPLIFDQLRRDRFLAWFRRVQPDVVIGHDSTVIDWMESAGARVPATHGFVSLNLMYANRPCAGLDQQPSLLGARAAELVISKLNGNDRGIADDPVTTTITSRWIDGPTLRQSPPA
jgi:LacI family transcriptional regulator